MGPYGIFFLQNASNSYDYFFNETYIPVPSDISRKSNLLEF